MACNSCGRGQILRVERPATSRSSAAPKFAPKTLGGRKTTERTVPTKPANDLDKHRG